MDFHGMKRKELQALCKKHNIPANLTNLEMSNLLTSLLKEKEKPITRGRSCLKGSAEIVSVNDSDVEKDTRPSKKVKFSPQSEIIEFEDVNPDPRENRRMDRKKSRMKPVVNKSVKFVENVDNFEFSKEIVDSPVRATRSRARISVEEGLIPIANVAKKRGKTVENVDMFGSSKEIVDNPVRATRSRAHASVESGLVTTANPPVKKKRGRKAVKDVDRIDVLQSPVVDSSGNSAAEEIVANPVRATRSRAHASVENGLVLTSNPPVEKKRAKKVVKDVDRIDGLQALAVDLSDNPAAEETELPTRRLLRNREVVESGVVLISNPPVEKGRARRKAKAVNRSDEPPPSVDLLSDNAAAEETELPTKRSMRNQVVVGEGKKGVEGVGDMVSRKNTRQRTPNKRSAKSSDEVPEDEAIAAENVITQPEKALRTLRRNGAEVKRSEPLIGDLGKAEIVRRGKITLSKTLLGVNASAVDSETKTETKVEVQREAEVVVQIEEPLPRTGRSSNRRKTIMPEAENEEPLRLSVRDGNGQKSIMPQAENEEPSRRAVRDGNRQKSIMPRAENEEPLQRAVRNGNRRKSIMPQAENAEPHRYPGRNGNRRKSVIPQADGPAAKRKKSSGRSRATKPDSFEEVPAGPSNLEEAKCIILVDSVEMQASKSAIKQTKNREEGMEISVSESVVITEKLNMSPEVDTEKSLQDDIRECVENDLAPRPLNGTGRSRATKPDSFEEVPAGPSNLEEAKRIILVDSVEMQASKSASQQTKNREDGMEISVSESVGFIEKFNMSPEVDTQKSLQDDICEGIENDSASQPLNRTGDFGTLVDCEPVKVLNIADDPGFAETTSVADGYSPNQSDSIAELKNVETEERPFTDKCIELSPVVVHHDVEDERIIVHKEQASVESEELHAFAEPVLHEPIIENHSAASNQSGGPKNDFEDVSAEAEEASFIHPSDGERITSIAQEINDIEDTENFVEAAEPHESSSRPKLQNIQVEVPLTKSFLIIGEPPIADTELSVPEVGEGSPNTFLISSKEVPNDRDEKRAGSMTKSYSKYQHSVERACSRIYNSKEVEDSVAVNLEKALNPNLLKLQSESVDQVTEIDLAFKSANRNGDSNSRNLVYPETIERPDNICDEATVGTISAADSLFCKSDYIEGLNNTEEVLVPEELSSSKQITPSKSTVAYSAAKDDKAFVHNENNLVELAEIDKWGQSEGDENACHYSRETIVLNYSNRGKSGMEMSQKRYIVGEDPVETTAMETASVCDVVNAKTIVGKCIEKGFGTCSLSHMRMTPLKPNTISKHQEENHSNTDYILQTEMLETSSYGTEISDGRMFRPENSVCDANVGIFSQDRKEEALTTMENDPEAGSFMGRVSATTDEEVTIKYGFEGNICMNDSGKRTQESPNYEGSTPIISEDRDTDRAETLHSHNAAPESLVSVHVDIPYRQKTPLKGSYESDQGAQLNIPFGTLVNSTNSNEVETSTDEIKMTEIAMFTDKANRKVVDESFNEGESLEMVVANKSEDEKALHTENLLPTTGVETIDEGSNESKQALVSVHVDIPYRQKTPLKGSYESDQGVQLNIPFGTLVNSTNSNEVETSTDEIKMTEIAMFTDKAKRKVVDESFNEGESLEMVVANKSEDEKALHTENLLPTTGVETIDEGSNESKQALVSVHVDIPYRQKTPLKGSYESDQGVQLNIPFGTLVNSTNSNEVKTSTDEIKMTEIAMFTDKANRKVVGESFNEGESLEMVVANKSEDEKALHTENLLPTTGVETIDEGSNESKQDCQLKRLFATPVSSEREKTLHTENLLPTTGVETVDEGSNESEQDCQLKLLFATPVSSEREKALHTENLLPTTGVETIDEGSIESEQDCQLKRLFATPVSSVNPNKEEETFIHETEMADVSVSVDKTDSKVGGGRVIEVEPREMVGEKENEHERWHEDELKVLFATPVNSTRLHKDGETYSHGERADVALAMDKNLSKVGEETFDGDSHESWQDDQLRIMFATPVNRTSCFNEEETSGCGIELADLSMHSKYTFSNVRSEERFSQVECREMVGAKETEPKKSLHKRNALPSRGDDINDGNVVEQVNVCAGETLIQTICKDFEVYEEKMTAELNKSTSGCIKGTHTSKQEMVFDHRYESSESINSPAALAVDLFEEGKSCNAMSGQVSEENLSSTIKEDDVYIKEDSEDVLVEDNNGVDLKNNELELAESNANKVEVVMEMDLEASTASRKLRDRKGDKFAEISAKFERTSQKSDEVVFDDYAGQGKEVVWQQDDLASEEFITGDYKIENSNKTSVDVEGSLLHFDITKEGCNEAKGVEEANVCRGTPLPQTVCEDYEIFEEQMTAECIKSTSMCINDTLMEEGNKGILSPGSVGIHEVVFDHRYESECFSKEDAKDVLGEVSNGAMMKNNEIECGGSDVNKVEVVAKMDSGASTASETLIDREEDEMFMEISAKFEGTTQKSDEVNLDDFDGFDVEEQEPHANGGNFNVDAQGQEMTEVPDEEITDKAKHGDTEFNIESNVFSSWEMNLFLGDGEEEVEKSNPTASKTNILCEDRKENNVPFCDDDETAEDELLTEVAKMSGLKYATSEEPVAKDDDFKPLVGEKCEEMRETMVHLSPSCVDLAVDTVAQMGESVRRENPKAEEGNCPSAKQFYSTTMKRKNPMTGLIRGTPNKLFTTVDMKENAQSIKREHAGTLTAAKSVTKRRALEKI